ncbi:hypothetical protein [Microbacterium helvum]|uniref:hypothetical protein n=1 Tax=Microbacterium helvum TaxID=2773713 RepID=UPI002964696B|nr:hypothetical protein [Microbacterium helvum]
MPIRKPSIAEQGWALFDRIVERATVDGHTSPWTAEGAVVTYRPDFETLRLLLGVPLHLGANSQSGVPALALDVWIAYELRRAGFDPDAVWPRESDPRIMPAALAALLEATPVRGGERARLEERIRISGSRSGLVAGKAKILGKNYEKQVDVVLSDWRTGPEMLISTKRMDSSFGKNAANRVEESYGDAKNLRLRHPLASLGFVFGLRTTIYEKEAAKAAWLIDLLGKLGQEDDAYDAVALVLMEYAQDPPADGDDVNEPETGPDAGSDASEDLPDSTAGAAPATDALDVSGDDDQLFALDAPGSAPVADPAATQAAERAEERAAERAELDAAIAALPPVSIVLDDRVPDELHPARFLRAMVERTLAITPVDHHERARALLDAARREARQAATHG